MKAIKNADTICMNCLCNGNINITKIPELGFGSFFDFFETEMRLCDKCSDVLSHLAHGWDKLEKVLDADGFEQYKCEEDLIKFVEKMPLVGQELFYNRFGRSVLHEKTKPIEPQDWIDYKLDLLSYEKCKKYGFVAPEERKAYMERYPKCGEVYIISCYDGSAGSMCGYGACGEEDGACSERNIYRACYLCENYKSKEGPMKVVQISEDYINSIEILDNLPCIDLTIR